MEPITIPDIYCPFPSLVSPHLDEVRKHLLQWVQGFHLVQQEDALQPYLAADLPQFSCRVHPHAGLEELCLISDVMLWGFISDDLFDEGELAARPQAMQAIHKRLLAVLQNPSSVVTLEPCEAAFSDIFQRARRLTSSTWQRRYVHHCDAFFASQRVEAEDRVHKRIPERQAYIINRRAVSGASISLDMLELAAHFDIPTEIYESQLFQAIRCIVCDCIGWVNDVYSLRKEVLQGEVHNLVLVVQHEEHCSLQAAMNQVCAMIETETRRFQKLAYDVPAYHPSIEEAIHHYLSDLGSYMRGHLEWICENSRYARDVLSHEIERKPIRVDS